MGEGDLFYPSSRRKPGSRGLQISLVAPDSGFRRSRTSHDNEREVNVSKTITIVDATIVARWLKEGQATLVDVREPDEYAGGHLPGAAPVPLSSFDPAPVPVEAGKHLVFYCQSGRRCGPASEIMAAAGFAGEINRLAGGFGASLQGGGPVER
jgi:rhodanese-related sulfurtransferase